MRLSRRLDWATGPNRLTAAVEKARGRGPLLDLTISNPTGVGLRLPDEGIAEALARGSLATYESDPRGLIAAREALAAFLEREGHGVVSPDELVLTASTSEAYSLLFKVLADPGETIVTTAPAYPLLDHLVALDGLTLERVPLEHQRRFSIDPGTLASTLGATARAVVLVHPNNPTGNYLRQGELDAVAERLAERELPLVSDEVFHDYPLVEDSARAGTAATRTDVVAIALGGLSKSAGLPGLKLGWARVGGPKSTRRALVDALALAADGYLSVATPVQHALGTLLELAPRRRAVIRSRLEASLAALRTELEHWPALELLTPEGGWSAVLRLPAVATDEAIAVTLVERDGVVVQPGYFFDFEREAHVVVSLLTPPERLADGARRLGQRLEAWT